MTARQTTDPTIVCEEILRADKDRNIELRILPSETAIIDRLLERRIELVEAYAEVHSKLNNREHGISTILGIIVNAAAFWNPDRMSKARNARDRLETVNQKIAEKAAELADLLEERSELHNSSGFASDTHYHIGDVIGAASASDGHFLLYLKPELEALCYRFDLKYWPRLSAIMEVIARDAEDAEIEATDPLTAAGTTGARASRADFFKALFANIEENGALNYGHLPRRFQLSDKTLASFANCALDLGPDDLVDDAYVKRLRQRTRDARCSA